MNSRSFQRSVAWLIGFTLFTGCAFNVVSVKQTPANFSPVGEQGGAFILTKEVKVRIGTGFATILKSSTSWRQVGRIEQGEVYLTKDQVVKIEDSNIYEAYLVVSAGSLVGFYLPVEKTFSPVSPPVALPSSNVTKP